MYSNFFYKNQRKTLHQARIVHNHLYCLNNRSIFARSKSEPHMFLENCTRQNESLLGFILSIFVFLLLKNLLLVYFFQTFLKL